MLIYIPSSISYILFELTKLDWILAIWLLNVLISIKLDFSYEISSSSISYKLTVDDLLIFIGVFFIDFSEYY